LPPSGGILSTGGRFDSNLFIPGSEFAGPSEEIESVTVFRTPDFDDALEFLPTDDLLDSRLHLLKSEMARQLESFALSSERPSDFGFPIPSFPVPRKCSKRPNSPLQRLRSRKKKRDSTPLQFRRLQGSPPTLSHEPGIGRRPPAVCPIQILSSPNQAFLRLPKRMNLPLSFAVLISEIRSD
jgi:hypothetical protein